MTLDESLDEHAGVVPAPVVGRHAPRHGQPGCGERVEQFQLPGQ
jgi:hypothetical protein